MNKLEIKAWAKINFSIDVVGKRQNGYHEVKMIMQTLELHDIVELEKIDGTIIQLVCKAEGVPEDSTNIACKAAHAFLEKYGLKSGIKITIDKKIPVCAGLAGGSADAAAVIRGLNELFEIGADEGELCELGVTIGADVPFCICAGTMLAQGIGEELTRLTPVKKAAILLVKPGIDVSTKWVYQNFDLRNHGEKPDTQLLIRALNEGDIYTLAQNMKNVLESVTVKQYPVIEEIKKRMLHEGAIGSIMSGSGSAVFGIFADKEKAASAHKGFKNSFKECFVTETYGIIL